MKWYFSHTESDILLKPKMKTIVNLYIILESGEIKYHMEQFCDLKWPIYVAICETLSEKVIFHTFFCNQPIFIPKLNINTLCKPADDQVFSWSNLHNIF